jgi:hypothetical protein
MGCYWNWSKNQDSAGAIRLLILVPRPKPEAGTRGEPSVINACIEFCLYDIFRSVEGSLYHTPSSRRP